MRSTLLNRLARNRTVQAFLLSHKTIWQMVVALLAAVDEFGAHLDAIDAYDRELTSGTKGVTRDKRSVRQQMSDAALTVAGAVRAYASKTGNATLFDKMDYTPSSLKKVRDAEIGNVCTAIHDEAQAHLAALADYGVTAPTLAALNDLIDVFGGKVTQPRAKRSSNRAAGEMLPVEFASADRVLAEEIDGMMKLFAVSQPEFYAGYLATREVIDQPGVRKAKTPPPTPPPA
jgi:hypothetical protein